jgi:hypothetical protein
VPHGVRSIESEPDDEQCYLVKLVLNTGPGALVKDGNDAGMRWFSRRQNARGTRMDADGSLIWFGSDVADGLVPEADG